MKIAILLMFQQPNTIPILMNMSKKLLHMTPHLIVCGLLRHTIGENDVGHAFYRLRTDAPSDAISYIGQGQNFWFTNSTSSAVFYTNMTVFSGMQVGFYPASNNIILSFPIPLNVSGQLFAKDPCTTPTVMRTFSIGFDDLIIDSNLRKANILMLELIPFWGAIVSSLRLKRSKQQGETYRLNFHSQIRLLNGLEYKKPFLSWIQLNDENIYDSR